MEKRTRTLCLLVGAVVLLLVAYFGIRGFNKNQEKKAARRYIQALRVKAPDEKVLAGNLSGGNQQKVVIAKWLNTDPKLFILDGPTVGVDIGAKAEIHAILRDLAQKGIGIIVISDDLPELVQNCNKIIVMRDGKVEAAVDNSIDELSLSNLLIGASDAAKSAAQTTEQEVEEK